MLRRHSQGLEQGGGVVTWDDHFRFTQCFKKRAQLNDVQLHAVQLIILRQSGCSCTRAHHAHHFKHASTPALLARSRARA